ncbi:MAG: GNAT family N-acetyltransferase [Pseudomonadota bacterium]
MADIAIRPALPQDQPAINDLIRRATLALASDDYSPLQLEGALDSVLALDEMLIDDGTYYVLEVDGKIAACGGWSARETSLKGRALSGERRLDPSREAAHLRAFFVEPDKARQGLASRLLAHCEDQARAAGFKTLETGATMPGVRLYRSHGYRGAMTLEHAMPNGEKLRLAPMHKSLID